MKSPITLILSVALPIILLTAMPASAQRYIELVDSASLAFRKERWGQAERCLKEALRLEPANPGNTLLFSNLGVAQMEQGRPEEAVGSFTLALVRAPKSTTILRHRTRALLALGRTDEALEDLNAILQTDSVSEWALQTRGLLRLSGVGEPGQGHRDFRLLKEHWPQNPWGWFGLGCLAQGEDLAQATRWLRKAHELSHDPEISFRLAMALLELSAQPDGSEALKEAGGLLRESLKENPGNPSLYVAMAIYHRRNYQNEEAQACLKLAEKHGASRQLLGLAREGRD